MGKVSFGKGLISTYLDGISTHQEMIFFDTVNKHIYLNGVNYSDASNIAFSGTHSLTGITGTNVQDCITQLEQAIGDANEIFWCTYGTTTQTEIQSAVTAGKMVACTYGDNIYRYEGESSAGYAQFTAVVYDTIYRLYCKNSSWGTASFTIVQSSDVHNIPSGGTTGQVLKKVSGTNYDVEWANESGGSSDEALSSSEIQTIWNSVFGAPLISFTINGTTYQAEDGMTWAEWVESEHNTDGFVVNNDKVWLNDAAITNSGNAVSSSDLIVADNAYATAIIPNIPPLPDED